MPSSCAPRGRSTGSSMGVTCRARVRRAAHAALSVLLAAALAGCDGNGGSKDGGPGNGATPPDGPLQLQALFAGAQFKNGAPSVGSIAPADGDPQVPLGAPVVVTFSESVDTKSVNQGSFQLEHLGPSGFGSFLPGQGPVAGAVAVDPNSNGRVAVFLPSSPLLPSSRYAVRLGGGILDLEGEALVGGALGGGEEFGFETVAAPGAPFRLMATWPPAAETHVPPNAKIVLYFSAPVAMNGPGGIKSSGNLVVTSLGATIAGTVAAAADPRIAVFTPAKPFKSGAEVTVRVQPFVTDQAGTALAATEPIETTFSVTNVAVPSQIVFPGNAPLSFGGQEFAGTVTLDNIDELRSEVFLSSAGDADSITLLMFQSGPAGAPGLVPAQNVGRAFTKATAGAGAKFKNDLSQGGSGAAFLDSNQTPPLPIVVGAYATKDGVHSPVGPPVLLQLFKKTSEPVVSFGPPVDPDAPLRLRTELRLPVLYGLSSEPLDALRAFVDVAQVPSTLDAIAIGGDAGVTDADGRFVTSTFAGPLAAGAVRFLPLQIGELRITDSVGNVFVKKAGKAGSIHFEGGIGGPLESGTQDALRVRAVRGPTLAPLKSASVRVRAFPYDALGGELERKTTASGEARFLAPELLAFGPRLFVTVARDGFDVVTIAGVRNPGAFGDPFGISVPLPRVGHEDPMLTVKTKGDIPEKTANASFAASSANGGRALTMDPLAKDARFASDAPLSTAGTTTRLELPHGRPFVPSAFEHDGDGTFVFQHGPLLGLDENGSFTFDFAPAGGAMLFSDRFANTVVTAAQVAAANVLTPGASAARGRLIARVPGLPDVLPLSFFPAQEDVNDPNLLLLFAPVPPTLDENEIGGAASANDPVHELLLQPGAATTADPPPRALLEDALRLEVEAADPDGRRTRFRARLDFAGGSVPTTEPIDLPVVPLAQQSPGMTTHPPALELFSSMIPGDGLYRVTLQPAAGAQQERRWITYVAADRLETLPAPTLRLPPVAAKGFAGPGTFSLRLDAFEFEAGTFDFDAFALADVEREHRRHARSAPATVTTTP